MLHEVWFGSNFIQHRATGCSNDATCCMQQCWMMLHATCCVRLNGPLWSVTEARAVSSVVLSCSLVRCLWLPDDELRDSSANDSTESSKSRFLLLLPLGCDNKFVSSRNEEAIDWLSDRLVDRSFDWLIDRLTNWFVDWPIDWLIEQSINWLTYWLIDWLIDRSTDWSIDWRIDLLIGRSTDWLNNPLINSLVDWWLVDLTDWSFDWLIDRLTNWFLDWPIDWLIEQCIDWLTHQLTHRSIGGLVDRSRITWLVEPPHEVQLRRDNTAKYSRSCADSFSRRTTRSCRDTWGRRYRGWGWSTWSRSTLGRCCPAF